MLNKTAVAMLAVLLFNAAQAANTVAFHESRIVDRKQRQVHADLNFAEAPYTAVDKSYEQERI